MIDLAAIEVEHTLIDLRNWMEQRLEKLKSHTYQMHTHNETYAVVEIPEWEMRQKLALVKSAILVNTKALK